MTEVIVQHLGRQTSVRLKCNDLVRKVAVYKDRLAVNSKIFSSNLITALTFVFYKRDFLHWKFGSKKSSLNMLERYDSLLRES